MMERSKEEVDYLLNQIQDRLEYLETEYIKSKDALLKRAEEIRKQLSNTEGKK